MNTSTNIIKPWWQAKGLSRPCVNPIFRKNAEGGRKTVGYSVDVTTRTGRLIGTIAVIWKIPMYRFELVKGIASLIARDPIAQLAEFEGSSFLVDLTRAEPLRLTDAALSRPSSLKRAVERIRRFRIAA